MLKVMLRYTVIDCNETIHLFEKTVDLPAPPAPCCVIMDPGMPAATSTPHFIGDDENAVAQVKMGTDGQLIAELFSGIDGAMTGEELAVVHAKHGWQYVREIKSERVKPGSPPHAESN